VGWSSMSPAYGEIPKPSVSDPLLTPDKIRAYLIESPSSFPTAARSALWWSADPCSCHLEFAGRPMTSTASSDSGHLHR
jgi:hypothetical protein